MRVVALVVMMLFLAPPRSDADRLFRWELAVAIVNGTDDEHLQEVLVRLAFYEASFRRYVATCRVKGDKGKSHGLFQIQPQTKADRTNACGPLAGQVELALRYIDRSLVACAHLEPRDRLSMYTAGRCLVGEPAARKRWGAP